MSDITSAALLVRGAHQSGWGTRSAAPSPSFAWQLVGTAPSRVYRAWRTIRVYQDVRDQPHRFYLLQAGVIAKEGASVIEPLAPVVRSSLLVCGRVFLTARRVMDCLSQQRRFEQAVRDLSTAWHRSAVPEQKPNTGALGLNEEGGPRPSSWLDRQFDPDVAQAIRYHISDPVRRSSDVIIATVKVLDEGFELVMLHVDLAEILRFEDPHIQDEAQDFVFWNGDVVLESSEDLAEKALEHIQRSLAPLGFLQRATLDQLVTHYNAAQKQVNRFVRPQQSQ